MLCPLACDVARRAGPRVRRRARDEDVPGGSSQLAARSSRLVTEH